MNWISEWQALSNRILGLIDACHLFYQTQIRTSSGNVDVCNRILIPQVNRIFGDLANYYATYKSILPANAAISSKKFIDENTPRFNDKPSYTHEDIQHRIIALASFRTEFSYQLSDTQVIAKRLSERAFLHLKRSIVADPTIRNKWKDAFKEGEVQCEKLGAAHLLSHGIWAFKVNAKGERTDLVFPEPIQNLLTDVEGSAEALVLTEWKVARKESEVALKISDARQQAALYRRGALGGLELRNYQYIVIVTEKREDMPSDEIIEEITYRNINIAVDPAPPSKK